jgi:organic hydroperoxide reductase OsmC/OhrA
MRSTKSYGESMTTTHTYQSSLAWSGSTGAGYRGYSRNHEVAAPPAVTELKLSADATFGGDADRLNPEQLLLAAASSCQLLSFLALAANAGIEVLHYEDDADAVMPSAKDRMRITRIVLRPQIVVAASTDLKRVKQLVAQAHDGCYVANTLNADVVLEPAIEHVADGRGDARTSPPSG